MFNNNLLDNKIKMQDYYRVLELIEENKDNIPQGHYIEIMEKFKKAKEINDKNADRLDDDKKEIKKIRLALNENNRIKLLKKRVETLELKCEAYKSALLNFEIGNISHAVLDDFNQCPLTNRTLYNLRIEIDDPEEGKETVNQNNYQKCCVCNITMHEINSESPHFKGTYKNGYNYFYCKNCWDVMD